jgi:hypothetical protein
MTAKQYLELRYNEIVVRLSRITADDGSFEVLEADKESVENEYEDKYGVRPPVPPPPPPPWW